MAELLRWDLQLIDRLDTIPYLFSILRCYPMFSFHLPTGQFGTMEFIEQKRRLVLCFSKKPGSTIIMMHNEEIEATFVVSLMRK